MPTCKICGAPHAACGPASTSIPVDQRVTRREQTMGLKRYETEVRGTRTTLLLSDEDAKAQGLYEKPAGKAAPTNKAASAGSSKTAEKK